MRTLLTLVFLVSASGAVAHSGHPPSPAVQGNGLSTQVLFIGADRAHSTLTVSVRITNTADTPVYLAIVGPEPLALDNKGGVHRISQISGMAKCVYLSNSSIDGCITNQRGHLPGNSFTLLPPKVPTLVNILFKAEDLQPDALISFTMNAALARGPRPTNRRSNEQKIEYINIHLPLLPID